MFSFAGRKRRGSRRPLVPPPCPDPPGFRGIHLYVTVGVLEELEAIARERGEDMAALHAFAYSLLKTAHGAAMAGRHVGIADDPSRLELRFEGLVPEGKGG